MKRKLVIAIVIWCCFILQTAVFPMLGFFSCVPDIMLILTVAMGFMQGRIEGIVTGFLCGLLTDLFYGDIFGFQAFLYMITGYFCGRFSQIYFDEDVKMPLLLCGACDISKNLVIYVSRFLLRGRLDFAGYLKSVILPEAVSTILFTLLLYRLFYSINHSLVEKEKKGTQTLWIRE